MNAIELLLLPEGGRLAGEQLSVLIISPLPFHIYLTP